jgi:hypothetical protein
MGMNVPGEDLGRRVNEVDTTNVIINNMNLGIPRRHGQILAELWDDEGSHTCIQLELVLCCILGVVFGMTVDIRRIFYDLGATYRVIRS